MPRGRNQPGDGPEMVATGSIGLGRFLAALAAVVLLLLLWWWS
jgi:hypothetical protein